MVFDGFLCMAFINYLVVECIYMLVLEFIHRRGESILNEEIDVLHWLALVVVG